MYRRDFLRSAGQLAAAAGWLRVPIASASASALASASPAVAADDSLLRWERIRPDAWVVFNGGGNTLVIAEGGKAIVVDCKINGIGQLLRAEIESRVGPIAAMVFTHHHGDHSGGYPAFAGARALAHVAALPRIRARAARMADEARNKPAELTDALLASLAKDFDVPRGQAAERAVAADLARLASADPAASVPTESFADRTELRVGETVLELRHVGPAHTDNDLFVLDRRRGILHAGDLLFHRHHAAIDVTAGGTIQGWVDALREVRRACSAKTVVIAGHGPTSVRTALDEQTTYFERLRDLVARERAAGRSRDEVVKLPNTLTPTYGFVGEWPENLGVAYDELARRTAGETERPRQREREPQPQS